MENIKPFSYGVEAVLRNDGYLIFHAFPPPGLEIQLGSPVGSNEDKERAIFYWRASLEKCSECKLHKNTSIPRCLSMHINHNGDPLSRYAIFEEPISESEVDGVLKKAECNPKKNLTIFLCKNG